MNTTIDALTAEQAERSVVLLYELIPTDRFPGSNKPSWVANQLFVERMEDQAPPEVQERMEELREQKDDAARGEAAKLLLHELERDEALSEYVNQAVNRAAEPQMVAPDPLTIVIAIGVLATLPRVRRDKEGKWEFEFDPAKRAVDLVKGLTNFVVALPSHLFRGGS